MENCSFVVVGGGIAGVSCAEGLTFLCPDKKIFLLTASPLVKAVTKIVHLSKTLCQFDVAEVKAETFADTHPSVTVIQDTVMSINTEAHTVFTTQGRCIKYEKICICTGASPKVIKEGNPFVLSIRDTDSVKKFQERIKDARRIVVIGNGGIATELVHEVEGVDIIWVIKDKHISATFVDPGAAEFFQTSVMKGDKGVPQASSSVKRLKYTVDISAGHKNTPTGAALGPDWHSNFNIHGTHTNKTGVIVEYETEVKDITCTKDLKDKTDEFWSVYVHLKNDKIYGCDFIVSATGVIPNNSIIFETNKPIIAEDGGIKVNWKMESTVPDMYAAGDVCTSAWEHAAHWFQMRLWTQARQMGMYAAKCMVASITGEEVLQDFCFELFSHVTKFFGYKVVLLGLYNGQTLDGNYEALLRVTKGMEFIKLVMKDGKMQGAVLIGETDLEEMCENLILNQLDLSAYGEDLLNPDIDIEDYFD